MPNFLGTRYRVFWSKAETVDRVADIQHAGVRGCLQFMGLDNDEGDGIEINHAGDLPARSGLGSSSAFTVGMLHALHLLEGRRPGRALLAAQAIEVEQKVLAETVGIQDQIQCAWGGPNVIRIDQNGGYSVHPLVIQPERQKRLESHLLLAFTNLQRHASEIAKEQVSNVERKQEELHEIARLVEPAAKAMVAGDAMELGDLLHQTWMLKRALSDKIAPPEIDATYEKARAAGAWGGKLLGAGGGGFFLFCAPPDRHLAIAEAIGLTCIPVRFENRGSQVVLAE
jgi:D-glycero-alpha-D-manno-heptose-7-phosphate kinase